MIKKILIEGRTYIIDTSSINEKSKIHHFKFTEKTILETALFDWMLGESSNKKPLTLFVSENSTYGVRSSGHIQIQEKFSAEKAFAVSGIKALAVSYSSDHPFYLLSIIQDVHQILTQLDINPEHPHGIRFKADDVFLEGYISKFDGKRIFSDELDLQFVKGLGFGFSKPDHLIRDNECLASLSKIMTNFPFGASSHFMGIIWDDKTGIARIPDPETMVQKIELDIFVFDEGITGY